ncbi:hypothetical protein [Lysinibacillus fusiformis]|uniref:hypothetical protein n=1 Tax=Lysinibacillus fusiformis TaxID=28031 RepID=UPI000890A182|nr:hypothetical protein [Lysinibacillus fusiformis]SCX52158.1 hypothetical protein SAMN02787108_01876 [Lysinibacillus fusiformis]SDB27639.1 hypothetical protein SAMN02787070_01986 [Lysinibacillus fusiformis]SFI21683.1 hypothetical protein SAMN02787080_01985 [Lysinibacillus fusiformis]SFS81933.1 hypothetical protein SAMN02787099_01720 [Lysinibacillus fusiformis]
MKQEQLNAIKERVAKATQGPWLFSKYGNVILNNNYEITEGFANKLDALFIANARKDVPALVAEVERLHKALEKVMEVEAPIAEGWETPAYKIAQEALGGEAHE